MNATSKETKDENTSPMMRDIKSLLSKMAKKRMRKLKSNNIKDK